ncbi:MAG TPA: GAF domain-containing protein [Vicinamibacteria bacterium]|nr:GAF domain-containing protein [Vicinamibacteria bacterium]
MNSGAFKIKDVELHRHRQLVTALTRWLSVAFGLLALFYLWDHPGTHPIPCLTVALVYLAFNFLATRPLLLGGPHRRAVKISHDLADALAIGVGAAYSGGLSSPVWLLLYPHVVAVSVRGGLRYAMALGALDAAIAGILALQGSNPLLTLHPLAILFCAFMGGVTSSHLHKVQRRLTEANRELQEANLRLTETIARQEAAQREQEATLSQLRDSEQRYRRLLERIQDGVVIIQDDGRVAYVNQLFAERVGRPGEEIVGRSFLSLAAEEDRKRLHKAYARWQESQGVLGGLEVRLLGPESTTLLANVRAGSVEFEGRRSVIATIRDISRERQMEDDLKAHAERLAALNEIANAVNMSLTIEDIFTVAAEEARRLVPCDRLTLALLDEGTVELLGVGPTAPRRLAPFAASEVAWALSRPVSWCEGDGPAPDRLNEVLEGPGIRSLAAIPLRSKQRVIGSLNLGRLVSQPFSAWDLAVLEPVARQMAIALDNARLLETVKRRGRESQSLFEIGRAIVARLDLDTLLPLVVGSVNRILGTHYCLLLLRSGDTLVFGAQQGLEPEIVSAFQTLRLGDSVTGWVAANGQPLMLTDMSTDPRLGFASLAERYGYRSYLCVPLKRGEEVLGTLEVVTKETRRFRPEERDLMAAFAGAAAVAIENARLFEATRFHLGQLEQANQRLEELDRLRREYLRNVSHEFRTPLTVIKGYAEFLLEGTPEPASFQEIMRVILESGDRVIDLVDTLIEVTRIEQGDADRNLKIQSLDLGQLALASAEALGRVAAKKGVLLDFDFPEERLPLEGDEGLLHQAVKKLLDNAVKYSPPGGRVVLRGRARGEEVRLDVEDGGIGIAAEHVPRIFEKFYMVDGGLTRRQGGTGVGLYLVKEIVRLHRGAVEVESRPGRGSVFSVRLPRLHLGRQPEARA